MLAIAIYCGYAFNVNVRLIMNARGLNVRPT